MTSAFDYFFREFLSLKFLYGGSLVGKLDFLIEGMFVIRNPENQ